MVRLLTPRGTARRKAVIFEAVGSVVFHMGSYCGSITANSTKDKFHLGNVHSIPVNMTS